MIWDKVCYVNWCPYPSLLFQVCEHDDGGRSLLPHHAPEVRYRIGHRTWTLKGFSSIVGFYEQLRLLVSNEAHLVLQWMHLAVCNPIIQQILKSVDCEETIYIIGS